MNIIIYLLISIVFMSLTEYVLHRYFMHRKQFPSIVYRWLPFLNGTLYRHAYQHHKDDNTTNIDLEWWYAGMLALLPCGVMWLLFETTAAVVMMVFIIVYANIWTWVHRSIHGLKPNMGVAKWLPFYRNIENHHLGHHNNPYRNYGTLFIFSDYLFRSKG